MSGLDRQTEGRRAGQADRESCSQLEEKWLPGQSVDRLNGEKNRRFEAPQQLKADRRLGQDCHWARLSESAGQYCQLFIILSRYCAGDER